MHYQPLTTAERQRVIRALWLTADHDVLIATDIPDVGAVDETVAAVSEPSSNSESCRPSPQMGEPSFPTSHLADAAPT
jgi:hypothetical protein